MNLDSTLEKYLSIFRTNNYSLNNITGKSNIITADIYYDSIYGHLKLGNFVISKDNIEITNIVIKDEFKELRISALNDLKEIIKK